VVLVVVTGQIASGKSTIARAVARALEDDGSRAAVLDLDVIYELLDPARGPKVDQAKWTHARQLVARIAAVLIEEGMLVVVEGEFLTTGQRAEFTNALPPAMTPRFVTLRLSFAEALKRANMDSTRGLSRDPTFLEGHYAATADAIRSVPSSDLALDTDAIGVDEAAQSIAAWLKRAT
jgi:predicted kinase